MKGAIERLFLYLFQIKFSCLIIVFGFVLFQCQSSNDENAEVEPKNRIRNADLRKYIPQLVELRDLTIDDRANQPGELYVYILTTENFVYVHTSVMDCINSSFYRFSEKIGDKIYPIWIDKRIINPERYFDLEKAQLIERNDDVSICHDWYWVKAKFSQNEFGLKLTKFSSFYDNTYSENDFYDKEDSAFLHNIGYIISEPEPNPSLK